ncbi:MFS transporter, ACS family, glucarate transporter [Spirosomataceae bacterium TFI 002]|nr:MFS transporter, ACS family, glucarate transporter [Spirosomataceae bacterium TFI 002]
MKKRHLLVVTTFSLTLLLYIDRVCISAAKGPISDALGLDDKQFGWVLSAFALGYALFQAPSGKLVDKYGPRIVITSIVTIWSVLTAVTGAAFSFVSLLTTRFLFGVGEAGAFPGIAKSTYSWIPLQERGIVTGINFSGSRLGAAFAMPLITWMIATFDWRNSFYILGFVGVFWALVWYYWFRDKPEEHSSISSTELDYIIANRQDKTIKKKALIPFMSLIKSNSVLLAMGQYFSSNYINFFCLSWLFPYVKERYGLSMMDAGFHTMFPLLAGAFGNYFSGYLVDKIYNKGNWKLSRRVPAIIGFSLVIVGLMISLQMESVQGAVIFLSLAVFGADMTLSPSWSYCVDIGKENAGAVSGTMNMAGNIGSFLTALAFPYLADWTGTTDTFFYVGAILALFAIFCWLKMNPQKSLTV